MSDKTYRVKLEGQGLVLEREIPEEVGNRIAVLILTGGDASKVPGEREFGGDPLPAQKAEQGQAEQLSAREFLTAHDPKRGPDKVTTLAAYLKEHEGMQTFTVSDLRGAFEAAAEPIPANLPRDVSWAVKAGWVAPKAGVKGEYYITNSGHSVVQKNFPAEVLKKTRLPQGSRRGSGKKVDKTGENS